MKNLQLKDIIPYIFWLNDVKIYQGDIKTNTKKNDDDNWEKIFEGSIMDIPWYMMEFYLTNTVDSEAIASGGDREGDTFLEISVCEDKKIANKYRKGEL